RKAPSERYANGAELIADLSRFLDGHPVLARGGERGYRLRKFLGRHKLAAALTVSLAAVLVFGAVALAFQAYRLAEQRNAALLERDRANQVVEMLREAFLASDPARFTQGAVTASQVLRDAHKRIETLSDDQPDLYLSLASTI